MNDGDREVIREAEADARGTEEGLARAVEGDDIFNDTQYEHPLVAHLRERAEVLRRNYHMPAEAAPMNRAADVIEELYRQNVVLRRTLGMQPLPPLDIR